MWCPLYCLWHKYALLQTNPLFRKPQCMVNHVNYLHIFINFVGRKIQYTTMTSTTGPPGDLIGTCTLSNCMNLLMTDQFVIYVVFHKVKAQFIVQTTLCYSNRKMFLSASKIFQIVLQHV